MELTQEEADRLIKLEKFYKGKERFDFPCDGDSLRIPLFSSDDREQFSFDITRSRIILKKDKYQIRARRSIVLVRLETTGPPHTNPDGEELECPHIHLYREGYGTKWAFPLPPGVFTNTKNNSRILDDFMNYCNIITKSMINKDLFI